MWKTDHRLIAATLLATCSCAARAPLSDADVIQQLKTRLDHTEDVTAALEWAELEELHLRPYVAERETPRQAGYWRAQAWTWSLPCLEARQSFLAAVERARSEGLPDDIRATGRSINAGSLRGPPPDGDSSTEYRLGVTFDILGILNLGRAPAAEELAEARVRRSLALVEETAWDALHEVDRSRTRLAASVARVTILEELVEEVRVDRVRIEVLEERGWLPAGPLAAATAMGRRAERRLAEEQALLAVRREQLSTTSGLPAAHPALGAVTGDALEGPAALDLDRSPPSERTLLTSLPRLRSARLDYATSEALVRRAAAEAWPEIGLGPDFRLSPDGDLLGGILDLSVPWPGSVTGHVRAAEVERERARQRLVDELRASLASLQSSQQRLHQARGVLIHQAPEIEARTAAAWRAARAQFSVDARTLHDWTDALERRIAGCVALADARETAMLADLDLRQAYGPVPEATP